MEEFIAIILKKMIDLGFSLGSIALKSKIEKINDKKLLQKKEKLEKEGATEEVLSKAILNTDERIEGKIIEINGEIHNKLERHLNDVKKWATEIGFRDLHGSKKLNSIYIELDTYLMPARTHFDKIEKDDRKPIYKVISETKKHCVILGQAGAGKTTSAKQLCNAFFLDQNDNRYSDRIPLLLRFRDLDVSNSGNYIIQDYFQKILAIKIQINAKSKDNVEYENEIRQETFFAFLNGLKPLIILDGFDEIASYSTKESIINEIRSFAKKLKEAKVIVTCRTGEFNYEMENTLKFEISPLSKKQIESFVHRWINSKDEASKFLLEIESSPFADASIKPLSLAHLCAIYERIGKIPERPKTVYRKVVNLLLEEWDEQRLVKRQSAFIKFESDRKFEFLSHLAYHFTTKIKTITFNHRQLIEAYDAISKNFNLTELQCNDVVNEIEAHTGLFLQSGYENYEFVHKSVQEYLTAEFLVKLPLTALDISSISQLGAELAITISLSSNPSIYFSELICTVLAKQIFPIGFYDSFINRLIQENPDFYEDDYVGISAFVLLSLLSNNGNILRRKEIKDTLTKERHKTFEHLLTIIKSRNSLIDVKKFYRLSKHNDSGYYVHVKFERTYPHIGRLPKTIYLPIETVEKIYYKKQ